MKSLARKMLPVLVRVVVEVGPVAAVVAGVLVALAQVSHSDWKGVFLYNGDSLVLPLLSQSLVNEEPFRWVFSTQTFLFPEYPIYGLCSALTGSPRAALLLNAVVNVLCLYALLRVIATRLAPGHQLRQIAFSLGAVAIFMFSVLSEHSADLTPPGIVGTSSMATLFLLTTYYYGVILVGLLNIALVLWFTRNLEYGSLSGARVVVSSAIVLVLGGLTMYSNPLYLLQVVLPLGAVSAVLLLIRKMPLRWFLSLAIPHAVAVAIGILFRWILSDFLVSDYRSYVGISRAGSAGRVLLGVLADWVTTPEGIVKLLLVAVPVIGSIVLATQALVQTFRRPITMGSAHVARTCDVFVVLFVSFSAGSLLLGHVLTGQLLTRYLIPLFIFPLLSVLLLADGEASRQVSAWFGALPLRVRKIATRTLATGVAAVSVMAIVLSTPPVVALANDRYEPAECLDDWRAGSDANGVGPFMVTRPIMLYGDHEGRVLQVANGFVVQPWMNNLALYEGVHFSYVLVDSEGDSTSLIAENLGTPASITSCPGFEILDYAGTSGERALNDWIIGTLAVATDGKTFLGQ